MHFTSYWCPYKICLGKWIEMNGSLKYAYFSLTNHNISLTKNLIKIANECQRI